MKINEKVYAAQTMLSETIPLRTFLVKGSDYSVLIDSGVASMLGEIAGMVAESEATNVRFLHNTHPHADHIGCNKSLKEIYGVLVAAPVGSERWIEDMEYHYEQFCLPFPDILAHSDATRDEILGLMDGGSKVDLSVTEGFRLRPDRETTLETLSFPGHMRYENGFIEHSTNTLILGDAITLYEADFFPGHFSPRQYRATLKKLAELNAKHRFNHVLTAHFEPTDSEGFNELLGKVGSFIDDVDRTILQILSESADPLPLEPIWRAVCDRMGRAYEFRGLAMVHGHLTEAAEEGGIVQSGGHYTLK